MKNYKEEVKAIRKEWIRSKTKMIEESVSYLKPWDYVICKDGIPRIGRKLEAYLSIRDLDVPEIIRHFRNKGFVIEQNDDNPVIYLKDNVTNVSDLYQEVVANLTRYAYEEWPSNWPKIANDLLTQDGIKVHNTPEDLHLLHEFVKNETFESIINKIQETTALHTFAVDGNVKLGIVSLRTDADKTIENFFLKQGFDLKGARRTLIMPLENKQQNGIIKYSYEQIYDNIASYLISRMKNLPIRKAEYMSIRMNTCMPKEVEDMLKEDGFVIKNETNDSLRISLL